MLVPAVLFVVFLAATLFLWSLPIGQATLLAVELPLAIAYFWAVFRCYGRSLTGRPLTIRA